MKAKNEARDRAVSPVFPNRFGTSNSDPIPEGLIGSTIVQMGTIIRDDTRPFLMIEFRPSGSESTRELILSFNDAAIWIENE